MLLEAITILQEKFDLNGMYVASQKCLFPRKYTIFVHKII